MTAVVLSLIPLCGVLFLGWSVFAVVLFYWMESVVAVLMLAPKIAVLMRAEREQDPESRGTADPPSVSRAIAVNLAIYGTPVLALGFFVVSLFGPDSPVDPGGPWPSLRALGIGLLAIVASQVMVYLRLFVLHYDSLEITIDDATSEIFSRWLVMFVTVLFAGGVVSALGTPTAGLVVMIAIKTLVDVVTPEWQPLVDSE